MSVSAKLPIGACGAFASGQLLFFPFSRRSPKWRQFDQRRLAPTDFANMFAMTAAAMKRLFLNETPQTCVFQQEVACVSRHVSGFVRSITGPGFPSKHLAAYFGLVWISPKFALGDTYLSRLGHGTVGFGGVAFRVG